MKRKIIDVKPKKYLQQGIRYCGGYTIKAILSAYNRDDGRHPKEYLPRLTRFIRFATPKVIQQEFHKHNFEAPIRRANNFSNNQKINLLKKELNKNHPIVILVGNGYTPKGKYISVQRHLISHWISIWGYDNKEKVFFIYDSYCNPKYYDKVPVGNVKRTYNQILRDWKGAIYTKPISFIYIPVIKN